MVLLAVVLNNLVEVVKCANNDSDSANSVSYRLPREVIPKHYDLLVNTYLGDDGEGFRFDGAVNIIVSLKAFLK